MVFDSLPVELRLERRWCFTGSTADENELLHKAPHALVNGMFQPIDVTSDHPLLLTFDEIYPLIESHPNRDVGYVLTKGDNLTCIDLDTKLDTNVDITARNLNIVDSLRTYTEVSRSGEGLHLWIKGEVEGAIKTSNFEIYSDQRFIICTGQTFYDAPLLNDPELIESFNDMRKDNDVDYSIQDQVQVKTDEEIVAEIHEHDHSGKFACLMTGNWEAYAGILKEQGNDMGFDASQADAAFMAIVTYYTGNFEQCKRLWRSSALADVTRRYPNDPAEQRRKARNIGTEYKLNRAIAYGIGKNEQDRKQRELVVEQSKANVSDMIAKARAEQIERTKANKDDIPYPPGRLGELAHYFYSTSIKPIKEFAIAEAIALAAGIFGRAYNVSNTGLNVYLMILAPSGTGKSDLSKNPDRLLTYLERHCGVMGAKRFTMSQRFTHENAMYKEFQERTSFTQCLSEFGKIFKNMVSVDNQGGALATVREQMTDVYSKSGAFDTVGGLRYTNQDNVVNIDHSVAYSFLGESVAEPFFDSVTADMFSDGFMSRFLVMEYDGAIPYDAYVEGVTPPKELTDYLSQACTGVLRALNEPQLQVCNVPFGIDATDWRNNFNRECTDKANQKREDSVWTSLWTRCNLKVMKIAALLAVMDNCVAPVITMQHVEWAERFVFSHNDLVLNSVRDGRLGSSHSDQGIDTIREIMLGFFDKPNDSIEKLRIKEPKVYKDNFCVPVEFIMRAACRRSVFKVNGGYKKPRDHIRESLRDMEEAGYIQKVPQKDAIELFKTTATVYRLIR